jgi:hypothetical protein
VNALRTEARAAVTAELARSIICRASAWACVDIPVASAAATNRSPARTAVIASATLGNAGTEFILASLQTVCRRSISGRCLLSSCRNWLIPETTLAPPTDISSTRHAGSRKSSKL